MNWSRFNVMAVVPGETVWMLFAWPALQHLRRDVL